MTISRSKRTRAPEEATKALRNARKGEGRSTVGATVSFLSFLEQNLECAVELRLARKPEELVADDSLVVKDVERRPAFDIPG